jgi:hypothetical protein
LIHPSLKILSSGTLEEGTAVWALLEHPDGFFGCVSIYAPNSARQRSTLWEDLKNTLPAANWILSGDYNMTEVSSDSSGLSPLLQGRELEAWRLFGTRFNQKDALLVSSRVEGAHFTWRRQRNGRLVQSWIDRFYNSDGGWWIDIIESLKHDSAQALLDHDPVTLTF